MPITSEGNPGLGSRVTGKADQSDLSTPFESYSMPGTSLPFRTNQNDPRSACSRRAHSCHRKESRTFSRRQLVASRWSFFTESAKLEMGRRVLLVVFLGLLCAAGKCGGMDHVGISSS